MRPEQFEVERRGLVAKLTPGTPYQRYGIPMVLPLERIYSICSSNFTTFTGINLCVNLLAGKTLGMWKCLFCGPENLNMTRRLMCSLREFSLGLHEILNLTGEKIMNYKTERIVLGLLIISTLVIPDLGYAHDGELLKDQITGFEKLITGGYFRLGLLAVCAFCTVLAIIKQSVMSLIIGVAAGVFAYSMSDWIKTTFAALI